MLLDLSKPYNLILGDCLEVMPGIPDGSVDAIIADWPYGTTACKWDSVIPLEPLWKECKRVIKKNGAIVLFGGEPFSSLLRLNDLDWYKYDWVWNKKRGTNFFAAKYQPLNNTENIMVFSEGGCNNGAINPMPYHPQGVVSTKKTNRFGGGKIGRIHFRDKDQNTKYVQTLTGYPFKILEFGYEKSTLHPTQKPVALMEYLIKTYTNPGDLVLDNTMGSGSTGEACLNTGRRFIGIEKDEGYFEIAKNRLERVERELRGEQLEMAI